MSPYGTTSVGSRSSATRFLMLSMRTTCESLIHKLGCLKPQTTCDLLDVTTNHTSREEHADDVYVDDIKKGVASF